MLKCGEEKLTVQDLKLCISTQSLEKLCRRNFSLDYPTTRHHPLYLFIHPSYLNSKQLSSCHKAQNILFIIFQAGKFLHFSIIRHLETRRIYFQGLQGIICCKIGLTFKKMSENIYVLKVTARK